MYHHFYHLTQNPFVDAPTPEFLFVSPSYKSALQALSNGIEERRGLLALISEPGLGKTTLLHTFLETIDPQRLKTIHLFYPHLSIHEMLEIIYHEFGLTYAPGDPVERINQLRNVLIEEYKKGRNVALIIDEAQSIPPQTLEYLLLLANLQVAHTLIINDEDQPHHRFQQALERAGYVVARNLIQVVLVGQPALQQQLKHPVLQPLYTMLSPLKKRESMAYIRHRLSKAAINGAPLFTKGALQRIVTAAKGNPRILNSLCANALILGALSQQQAVSSKLARKAIADFGANATSLFGGGQACAQPDCCWQELCGVPGLGISGWPQETTWSFPTSPALLQAYFVGTKRIGYRK